MKNVVFTDTAREDEFKPDQIFERYLAMNTEDLKKEFKGKKNLHPAICPACKSADCKKAFVKSGFPYVECTSCGTVYMSPRPDDPDIRKHFLTAPSSHYWQNILTTNTAEKRREKIYLPRFQWIQDTFDEYLTGPKIIADLNSKNSIFSRELAHKKFFSQKLIVNPYFNAAMLDESGGSSDNFKVISNDDVLKKDHIRANIITAFEVFDYTSDVEALMSTVHYLLSENGLFFITTMSISGFDLQVLWENSESVFPLDRINVFSYQGLRIFFERHGFEMIEFSTPGMLDLNIVEEAYRKNPDLEIPRFIRTMIQKDDEQMKSDFQTFLQVNKLSSFVRIVARKKRV